MTAAPATRSSAPPAATDRPRHVGELLRSAARDCPNRNAVLTPRGRAGSAACEYDALTFAELDAAADRLAAALGGAGVTKGERVALLVRPGGRFAAAVFGVLRSGAAAVLIDPGLGVPAVLRSLREVRPAAFLGEPAAVLAARAVGRLGGLKAWVSAGRGVPGAVGWDRFLAGGPADWSPPPLGPTDAAAVIFTSGSTGPAKGVAYEHGMFLAQIEQLREGYGLAGGEVDVPAFPLFALFDVGLRATMVVPRMKTHRPAAVRPGEILGPIERLGADRAFGSPALWKSVLREAAESGRTLPTVKRLLSAGAPVPPKTHEWARAVLPPGAQLHTPYGATEALPVCDIGTDEILDETAAKTRAGAGTCVGRPFPRVTVRVIAESDDAIASIGSVRDRPSGEIGEVIVSGPAVTREYVGRPEQTRRAKIADQDAPTGVWHRMGDMGYLDRSGRLWFCGRQAHVVRTAGGPVYPVRGEAIFNEHAAVARSAIVGVGPRGRQEPRVVVECERGFRGTEELAVELEELGERHPVTGGPSVLFRWTLPTDVRHNTKIDRVALARWAARRAPAGPPRSA